MTLIRLSNSKLNIAAFFVINCAFGPLAVLVGFKEQISKSLNLIDGSISLLYGAYFIVGGISGRFLALRGFAPPFWPATCVAASTLAVGSLCSAWLAFNFITFSIGFIAVAGACGGTWFLAPIATHVMRRTAFRPATGIAVATVGQLTAFGLWKFVFSISGVSDWRIAMTLAASVVFIAVPTIALIMNTPVQSRYFAPPSSHLKETAGGDMLLPFGFGLIAFAGTVLILGLGSAVKSGLEEYRYEIFSCAAILGRLVAASFFDRGWRSSSILSCCILMVVAAVGAANFVEGFWDVICAASLGVGYGGFLPLAVTYAGDRKPLHRERTAATMFNASCIGIGVGALLPLLAGNLPPWTIPSLVMSASVLALVLWYIAFDRPIR